MSKLIPMPSQYLMTERDVDKVPILEARHLGIDFGGQQWTTSISLSAAPRFPR